MAKMKGISVTTPGGPEQMVLAEHDIPVPKDDEVLIRVRAAGVNRPDVLQRKGAYPPPPGASPLLGLEVAGEVIEAGADVPIDQVGQPVMALLSGGGYAEFATAPATSAIPIPDGLSLEEAAGIPETFFTVWHNVFQRGGLKAGEVFLVHGGTSGIGTTAIQLAKAFGATVIATAGTDEKCAACSELGADVTVNYKTQDFVEICKAETGGEGVDLILDMVGGSYIERNFDAARIEGRIVQIAFLGGPKAEVDFRKLMQKRLTHTGSTLRARSNAFKGSIAQELSDHVLPLLQNGTVRPVMDETFDLSDASKAHERMESGANIGKIVLRVA